MKVEGNTSAFVLSRPWSPLKAGLLVMFVCAVCAAGEARAQTGQYVEDGAPPPMKFVPQELRARLGAAPDIKARTRLCLELADERLTRASEHAGAERFEEAVLELGIYEALVEDAVSAARAAFPVPNGKARDLFKRVELALRAQMPRVETLRRIMPSRHAVHVKAALEALRQARTASLESFYDDTVLRETPSQKERSADVERSKTEPPAHPPEKEKKQQR